MRKKIFLSLFIILILIACVSILNTEVMTRQGINYKVYALRIPLYLKILDFYDRHYNYKWLVHKITEGKTDEEDRVMALFKWTIENIAEQPKGLKTVDDHVWHIIVRGYGTGDQFSDVFTTLCNYADIDAFFLRLFTQDKTSQIPFSFVKINKRWRIFDPLNGIYFITKDGNFASVEEISSGNWSEKNIGDFKKSNFRYSDYFNRILSINFEEAHSLSRANIQSPFNRFIYAIRQGKF